MSRFELPIVASSQILAQYLHLAILPVPVFSTLIQYTAHD
jgi:hypothetical protein